MIVCMYVRMKELSLNYPHHCDPLILITLFLLLIIMTAMCGAALVYQDGYTALMQASMNGHKDVAVALVKKGADLNTKSQVSDCQLCVCDDRFMMMMTMMAMILASLPFSSLSSMYMYVYGHVCICVFVYVCICVCMFMFMCVRIYMYG